MNSIVELIFGDSQGGVSKMRQIQQGMPTNNQFTPLPLIKFEQIHNVFQNGLKEKDIAEVAILVQKNHNDWYYCYIGREKYRKVV